MILRLLSMCLLALCALCAHAADEPAPGMTREQFEASLRYQTGDIALPGGVATLKLPASFRYLGPEDAQRVLEQAWGNPHGGGTLGMLFPSEVSPLDAQGWGVVITYEEDGHVSDDDADSIDYDKLMKEMQEAVAAQNAELAEQGQTALELVGWAARPYYDKAAHKLHWAKELRVTGASENTLNYNIRVLGRKGVLVLNAVSRMAQLPTIQERMKEVLAFTEFTPGNGYADFDPDIDKTAAYGLAALVAGGVAAKAGLFAKIIALAIAFKKFLVLAVVGLFAGLRKLFSRKS